jgi:hypothetical protein
MSQTLDQISMVGLKKMHCVVGLLSTLLLLGSVASPVSADSLTIDNAWVRAMPPSVKSTAAYMKVTNGSDSPVEIVEVASEAADMVQMHEHSMKDGMMSMQQVFSVQVPANSEFMFAPGGHHIMLMGLTAALEEGDSVELTLTTKSGDSQVVQAQVMKNPPAEADTPVHAH